MRLRPALSFLAISGAAFLSGCSTVDFLTDNCEFEAIRVAWPATVTRGSSTTNVTLTGTVTPSNIDPAQFETLRRALITGDASALSNVVWTVDAFNVNGGYIAFQHPAPLASGQTEAVNLASDVGGWGTVGSTRALPPVVAVRAENYAATTASGSISAVTGAPLRLRIDVTTRNAASETIRLTGDAQFTYETFRSNCS